MAYSDLKDATLYKFKSFFFIPGYILRITDSSRTYQFGINPWIKIQKNLPFQYKLEKITLKHSLFSIVVRIALVAYIAYLLWQGS